MDPSSNHPSTSSECYKDILQLKKEQQHEKQQQPEQSVSSSTSQQQHDDTSDTTTTSPSTSSSVSPSVSSDDTLRRPRSFNDLAKVMQAFQKSKVEPPASPAPLASASASASAAIPLPPSSSSTTTTPSSKSIITSTPSSSSSSKKSLYRCLECHKKLSPLTYQTCRCSIDEMGNEISERRFCSDHRHNWSHKCTVDVRKLQTTVLQKANPEIKSNSGLERI